jgi:hypothetical protein
MMVVVRRVLLVNVENKEMAIRCMCEFGEYFQQMCDEVKSCRTLVLSDSDRLQAGTVEVSIEFELPNAGQLSRELAFDDESHHWIRRWTTETDAICIDSRTETWTLINP